MEQQRNARRGAPLFGFGTREVNPLILLCQSVIDGRKHFTHDRLQIWSQSQRKKKHRQDREESSPPNTHLSSSAAEIFTQYLV